MPTLLEAAGVKAPSMVNGVTQQPIDGTSLLYSVTDPKAAERHKVQYFEVTANRGIYADGWLANTRPRRMPWRSEEHTSELQSLMRISYAVFCLKKKQETHDNHTHRQ